MTRAILLIVLGILLLFVAHFIPFIPAVVIYIIAGILVAYGIMGLVK